jgi:cell division protein FtsQ
MKGFFNTVLFRTKRVLILGFITGGCGVIAAGVYFWNPARIGACLVAMGFGVAEVFVEGRKRTSMESLESALGLTSASSLLFLDLQKILGRLEGLPWIRSAVIERRLPDHLYIRICEKTVLGLWYHNGQRYLIDKDGGTIMAYTPDQKETLGLGKTILLVGKEAPSNFWSLHQDLLSLKIDCVETAVFLPSGRWDLYLKGGLMVKLPESDIRLGLQRFLALRPKLPKNTILLDLRFRDSVIVETAKTNHDNKTEKGKALEKI